MRFISNRRVHSLSVHTSQIIQVEIQPFEKEDPYSVDLMLAARIHPSL